MLFATHIATLSASVNTIQSQMDELENQLKALRAEKSGLEAELQTVLTLEGAAESAINQAQSFIRAAESLHRPDLVATFWDAMATLQGKSSPQLPPAPQTDNQTETVAPITPPPAPTADNQTETTTQSSSQIAETLTQQESGKVDTAGASLAELKRFVRSHQPDSTTKLTGNLASRKTWQIAAEKLKQRLIQ